MERLRRWETRVDEETDALFVEAAELLHTHKSTFVIEAAREKAVKVIARADRTLMAASVFDSLLDSLDVADYAPNLARRARRASSF